MRMIPIDEIKSIDVDNRENDKCPYGMSLPDDDVSCRTNNCMAWYWVGDNIAIKGYKYKGCCALIYKPETIDLGK